MGICIKLMIKRNSYKAFANPYIVEEGEQIDIFSKLIEKRTIFLNTEIDTDSASIIKAQLLYLDSISHDDITIMIDSPGGDIYTGLGIIDTIEWIKSDVSTVNIGLAASMAALILASGTKGKRKSLKRSRVMVHQPLGWSGDSLRQATDIEIDAKEILSLKNELIQILADKTSRGKDVIKRDLERDYWLTSKDAIEYGIIDKILDRKNDK